MGRLGSAQTPEGGLGGSFGEDRPQRQTRCAVLGSCHRGAFGHGVRKGLEDTWTTCSGRAGLPAITKCGAAGELAGVDEDHYLHETELRDRASLPDAVQLYRAAEGTDGVVVGRRVSSGRTGFTRLGAVVVATIRSTRQPGATRCRACHIPRHPR